MRRKSLSDGVFGPVLAELCMAALCSTGLAASSWRFLRGILPVEGEAMRLVVYGAVAVIALGSVLLGLDWVSAPMSPMADTEAGLRAVAPPRVAAPTPANTPPPVAATPAPAPVAPKATIGAPIVAPTLAAPGNANAPAPSGASAQAVAAEPVATRQPEVRCNVNACTAAYQSFRAADCTYQPSNGPRKLCAK
jgi:BA14K-like protein